MSAQSAVLDGYNWQAHDRPIRTITASYHVEYFDRGYWHTESEHVCEAHAKHRAERLDVRFAVPPALDCPVRVVKVVTAVERTVIE